MAPSSHSSIHTWTSTPGPLRCVAFIVTMGSWLTASAAPFDVGDDSTTMSHPQEHDTCDKEMCASIVSYCLIQEACSCDPERNCSCCAECALCLGDKFQHCYDCVGMRKGNYTMVLKSLPAAASIVGILDDPSPELFRSLTEVPLPNIRYTILRYPIVEELASHHGHVAHRRKGNPHSRHHLAHDGDSMRDYQMVLRRVSYNMVDNSDKICTAAYFDQCLPQHDCSSACQSMGATSFRWFQIGCCGCFGPACMRQGSPHPKCPECMQ